MAGSILLSSSGKKGKQMRCSVCGSYNVQVDEARKLLFCHRCKTNRPINIHPFSSIRQKLDRRTRFRGMTYPRNTPVTLILILAILSGVIALVLLFVPLGTSSEELSQRASVSAAIATIFVLISSVVAVVVTNRVSSSDYQAEQAVKTDTAKLLASLRSIIVKGAALSQLPDPSQSKVTFDREVEIINEFLTSTTAFAYWAWEGHKSELAKTGSSEEWRVFFLYLVDLLQIDINNFRQGISRAIAIEDLFNEMEEKDIRDLSYYLFDIAKTLSKLKDSRTKSILLNAMTSVYSKPGHQSQGEDPGYRMLKHLRSKGIKDPDIDLFFAVMSPKTNDSDEESISIVKQALEDGADPSLTLGEVLRRYESDLQDFK